MRKAGVIVRAAPVATKGGGASRPTGEESLIPPKPKKEPPPSQGKLEVVKVFTGWGDSGSLATINPLLEGIRTESPPAATRYPRYVARGEDPL